MSSKKHARSLKRDKSESLADKRAKWFLIGMLFVGIFLYSIMPQNWSSDFKGGVFLLCLAIGYLGGYHPERTKEVWNLIFGFFKKLFNFITSRLFR